jgi:hypothetical protein
VYVQRVIDFLSIVGIGMTIALCVMAGVAHWGLRLVGRLLAYIFKMGGQTISWCRRRWAKVLFVVLLSGLGYGLYCLIRYLLYRQHQVQASPFSATGAVLIFWSLVGVMLIILLRKKLWRWLMNWWAFLLVPALLAGLGYWTVVLYAKKYTYWWAPLAGVVGLIVLIGLIKLMMGSGGRRTSTPVRRGSSSQSGLMDALLLSLEGLAWMLTALSTLWWAARVLIGLNPEKTVPIASFAAMVGFAILRYLVVRTPAAKPNFKMIFGVLLFMCSVGLAGQFIISYVSHPSGTDPMIPSAWMMGKK